MCVLEFCHIPLSLALHVFDVLQLKGQTASCCVDAGLTRPLCCILCSCACGAGNRVTCRDWFQLTLKEGLTVFRDQGFSADMNSAAVKRIEVGRG